jgi:hypothetical protein
VKRRLFTVRVGHFAVSPSLSTVDVSVFNDPSWALHGEAGRIRGEDRGIDGEATPMHAWISRMDRTIDVPSP